MTISIYHSPSLGSYFNPCSAEHRATQLFEGLSACDKIKVVALTIFCFLATLPLLCLGGTAVIAAFRKSVLSYYRFDYDKVSIPQNPTGDTIYHVVERGLERLNLRRFMGTFDEAVQKLDDDRLKTNPYQVYAEVNGVIIESYVETEEGIECTRFEPKTQNGPFQTIRFYTQVS